MTLVTAVIQSAGPYGPYSLFEPLHRERAPTATNAMLHHTRMQLPAARKKASGRLGGIQNRTASLSDS